MSNLEGDMALTPAGYEHAMPPATRSTPSEAVSWAWEQLKQNPLRLKNALDLGCGRGRNTLFLARQGFHVTALDFAPNAIFELNEEAAKEGLTDKIKSFVQDVGDYWPVKTNEIDLVVDAFCFKHLDTEVARQEYKQNLLRVLGSKGHYLISLSSIGDGHYGNYLHKINEPELPVDETYIIDPYNGIESSIFSYHTITNFFSPELEIEREISREEPSTKAGNPAKRKVYAILFQRRTRKWY